MKTTDDFKRVFDTDCAFSHHVDDSYAMNAFHFHNVFEIYMAHTGGLTYFVENRIYPVEKNDLFVFNHLDLHRIGIAPQTHYERSIVVFNPAYVSSLSTDLTDLLACFLDRRPNFSHRLQLSDEQAVTFQDLFQRALQHGGHRQYGEDVRKKLALIEILLFINPLYQGNPEWIPSQTDAGYEKIRPIISYINGNVGRKLSLDELSERFYIDKYYLCKRFKETTGFTIHEYGMYRRIIHAAELLRKNLQVAQVAELTGFENHGHFITTFKKHVGITPKQYALRKNESHLQVPLGRP